MNYFDFFNLDVIAKGLYVEKTIMGLDEPPEKLKHPKLPLVCNVAYVTGWFFEYVLKNVKGISGYPLARIYPYREDYPTEFLNFALKKKEKLYLDVIKIPTTILKQNNIEDGDKAIVKIYPF